MNPRAGSRWLFAFAALSELPLEPGKWSSLRYGVTQWSKELANVGHDLQRIRPSKKEPQLVVSMQPGFKDLYARALAAGRPHMIDSPVWLPSD